MQVLAHEAGPVLLVLLAGVCGSLQVGALAALQLRLEEAGGVVVEEGVPDVAVLQRPDHLHALQGMRQLQGDASVADEHYPPRALQPPGEVLHRVLVPQDDNIWSLGHPLQRRPPLHLRTSKVQCAGGGNEIITLGDAPVQMQSLSNATLPPSASCSCLRLASRLVTVAWSVSKFEKGREPKSLSTTAQRQGTDTVLVGQAVRSSTTS